MLRYYLHDGSYGFRLKLSGDLTGADIGELEQCWRTALSTIGGRNFLVDLSDVAVVDDAGRALLDLWHRNGAQFIAKSVLSRSLVASIMGHSTPPAEMERANLRAGVRLRIAALGAAIAGSLLLPATVWADESAPTP